ncbi:Putative matrix-associated actin-dependent regulator of chromatin [Fulvia fulva]|uniref:Matrix-associated actin-dependent regulator of chromatin n=1 Tax=Passalora fulva TaxID=5499 RepID=A0A9Q8L978_PASFU|nr:Putative matrix-associated actin-dependent regulator of chromatin [Fulvia fulva]KAK4636027.1 putative matrix-associated actin-dependent regulator of chromatin [Fulvia fulva]KAK4638096.1 putative matrix-associated actin-dependent regulator of chromatin [Fulvia fulva]UJO13029.1 Putative matrix-associated actin-dependent regulator of chromatin [Fulvia fulva]WPV10164.1 Putative matrix-associated actin-dependent regulator of chromatin [Fulvia fulva]WPV25316.1 Putative matrix-associated actin-dep
MSQSTSDGKRKRVEIDLTNSGEEPDGDLDAPATKRTPAVKNAHRNAANRSTLPTPPASSARSNGYESVYAAPGSSDPQASQHFTQTDRDAWLADEDFNSIVASSQNEAEFNDQLYLYGQLPTKVVGVRYYRGYANPGEQILVRREPGNEYDSNAIRIDNASRQQIGHIPRTMAVKLVKYIDNGWLAVEGKLNGEIGQFDCPLSVYLYGVNPDSDEGRQLRDRMVADKLPIRALQEAEARRKQQEKEKLAAARRAAAASKNSKFTNQAIPGGSSQVDMSDIMEASQRINPRDIANSAEQLGTSEEDLSAMPMAEKPDSIQTEMLPYQRQALQWLLDQECPKSPGASPRDAVQLWTFSNGKYTNLATNHSTQNQPILASGGILADDMGLGKTLEMISLIAADVEKFGRGTTLVVAPLSMMSNWSGQIATHVKTKDETSVYTYHGAGRTKMKSQDFAQYDVVLTTYHTLASDYMPGGSDRYNKLFYRSETRTTHHSKAPIKAIT